MIWRLMVLPLSQKVVNFTNLGQGLSLQLRQSLYLMLNYANLWEKLAFL